MHSLFLLCLILYFFCSLSPSLSYVLSLFSVLSLSALLSLCLTIINKYATSWLLCTQCLSWAMYLYVGVLPVYVCL